MLKFLPGMTSVVMEEIPGRVTLAVDITRCRGDCPQCHSPFLREDIGEELTGGRAVSLVEDNFGVDCFLFLGEGDDPAALMEVARSLRDRYPSVELALALYSGRTEVEQSLYDIFDYVKTGPYDPARGPLDSPTTNQRLFRVSTLPDGSRLREDVTPLFWRRKATGVPSNQ